VSPASRHCRLGVTAIMPPGFEEVLEQRTQVRCRDCITSWVILHSPEDASSASHQRCEACLRKSNLHRAERRAQEPKPRGRPPKKKSNRGRKPKANQGGNEGDNDGDNDGDAPPAPPPAPRRRGRPPKQRPDAGGRTTAEPSPVLPTRLPTRHTSLPCSYAVI
jgi:hypothetical protein